MKPSKLGIYVPLIFIAVIIILDVYLALNGVNGDTITERIRELPNILHIFLAFSFGALTGHFWK